MCLGVGGGGGGVSDRRGARWNSAVSRLLTLRAARLQSTQSSLSTRCVRSDINPCGQFNTAGRFNCLRACLENINHRPMSASRVFHDVFCRVIVLL